MKKATLILAAGVFAAASANAQIIVDLEFDDGAGGSTLVNPGDQANTANISISAWTDEDADGVTSFGGNPGEAIADTGWDDGNAFLFSITVDPGFSMDLTGFSFDDDASSTGPDTWELLINGNSVGTGTPGTNVSTSNQSGALALSGLTGTVNFELDGTGASSSGGTYRIDNFQLTGSVVPEPSTYAAIAGALVLGLAVLRRRRK